LLMIRLRRLVALAFCSFHSLRLTDFQQMARTVQRR
jgi:hypothetical protein